MGVHGLWKLIESSGKPIPIETLENKVLAVDISIWLHQAIKGFQDQKGAPVLNAHLLGIYHRVCKLLYFKIKPVFVFDGGVPALKRQTIAKRNQLKSRNASKADLLQKQLLSTLLKHSAISKVLSEKAKASIPITKKSGKYDNLYALPSSSEFETLSSSEDEDTEETTDSTGTDSSPTKQWDLHTIDTTSVYFKSLPIDVKHEILTDLKETRKQNTWAKLHQYPKQSDDFATYQMKRLLKRQEVQSALDEVSKEMGGMSLSLADLESLLKDQGIKTINDSNLGKRIASDENTRYLYIKNLQEEIKLAKEKEQTKNNNLDEEEELKKAIKLSLEETPEEDLPKKKSKADLEEEEELKRAIQLSLEDTPSTSTQTKKCEFSFLDNFKDEDFFLSDSDEDYVEEKVTAKVDKPCLRKLSSAQSYMLEYSGLTKFEIDKIINKNASVKTAGANSKKNRVLTDVAEITSDPKQESSKCRVTGKTDIKNSSEVKNISDLPKTLEIKTDDNLFSDIYDKKSENNTPRVEKNLNNVVLNNESFKNISEIEIMSDSGDSSNGDADLPKQQPKLEVIIDPNKNNDEEDLFSDIFDNETEINKFESLKQLISREIKANNEELLVKRKTEDFNTNSKVEIMSNSNNNDVELSNKQPILHIIGSNKNDENKFNDTKEKSDVSEKPDNNQQNINDEKGKTTNGIDEKREKNGVIHKNNQINMDSSLNKAVVEPIIPKMTTEKMEELKENIQSEKIQLLREKANKERLANNITDQMYQEAQELLELFGVPYVIAPMEAEAQCAFLDEIELTEGSITDDSDIWLFGGRTVYKNFFNQSKYVMEFKSENIEHHFKLSRKQMILLALLVGSDYTTGIQGVGPVTALEILASFPPSQTDNFKLIHHQVISGLRDFKSWFLKGKTSGPGRSTLTNKLKNVTISDGFPNSEVVEAYLEPKVETSREKFSWDKPDITGLTVFAKEKFGWTMKKTEEILNPVIKKMEENQTQKSIKDYFKTKFKINPVDLQGKVSKRVKTAVEKLGKTPGELIAEEMTNLEKKKEKAIKKSKAGRNEKPKSTMEKKTETTDKKNSTTAKTLVQQSKANAVMDSNDTIGKKTTRKKTSDEKGLNENAASVHPKKRSSKKKEVTELDTSKSKSLSEIEYLKDYENLAAELKTRRKRKNEIMQMKIENAPKKILKPQQLPPVEKLPKDLEEDIEMKLLEATTSHSNRRVEEIKNQTWNNLEKITAKKKAAANLHTKEVIHQKLRDKSNLLKNKLKAIEIYRKSTKGPGYVPKRAKRTLVPKEEGGLSEDSD